MTCPPDRVQDMPERFSRCVKTILQAASVIPEPIGRRWLLECRERIQGVRFCREAEAGAEALA